MAEEKSALARTPALEWVAGGLGLVFLVIILAVVGRSALTGISQETPAIIVEQHEVSATRGGHVLVFEAVNDGGGTAAAVEIEGQLLDGGKVVETSTTTLDYVAGDSRAEGGLFFERDPRSLTVKLRALGYQAP